MISVEGGRGSVSLPHWEWYERGWVKGCKEVRLYREILPVKVILNISTVSESLDLNKAGKCL